jgi:hypothetical protein
MILSDLKLHDYSDKEMIRGSDRNVFCSLRFESCHAGGSVSVLFLWLQLVSQDSGQSVFLSVSVSVSVSESVSLSLCLSLCVQLVL